jgi:hypothetical protein
MFVETKQMGDEWFAEIWCNRIQFYAYAKTRSEAIKSLKSHLRSMVFVYESRIKNDQQTLSYIKSYVESVMHDE